MARLPTIEEFVKEAAQKAIDDYEYEGKTIREWVQMILRGDAVPMVRCKDCKYGVNELESEYYLCKRKMIGKVRHDDFCSYGERK